MNTNTYRLIFSKHLGMLVPVGELASTQQKGQGRHATTQRKKPAAFLAKVLALSIYAVFSAPTFALPTDPVVVNGAATFNQAGQVLTVTNSAGAVINWQTFNIGAGETTHFLQSSASSAVLNQVVTNNASALYGTLSSNGIVWLVNQAGIMVGPGAVIDTAGFVASTLKIRPEDFLAGQLHFQATAGAGDVVNQGEIRTPSGGFAYLIGTNVSNEGIITTPNGETILAAGNTVSLIDTSTPGVRVEITGAANNATNLGQIVAETGRIGIAGSLVKNSGTLDASSVVNEGGRVFLKASQDTYVDGNGRIVATGTKGGQIEVLGNRVAVMDNAQIDASGTIGGGTILVGGDYQGNNPDIQNAQITYFGPNATLKANATDNGNGGKVIVWADDTTRAYGSIEAKGGPNGGNGGFVETSGKQFLDIAGIKVITKDGTWLLDPTDITIVHSGAPGGAAFTGGIFENGGGATATLYDYDINTNLAVGNITITTSSAGGGSGDITFYDDTVAIAYNSSTSGSLTLNADNNIYLRGSVTNNSTIGSRALNLNAGNAVYTPSGATFALAGGYPLLVTTGNGKTWTNNGTINISADNTEISGKFAQSSSGVLNADSIVLKIHDARDIAGTINLRPGSFASSLWLDGTATVFNNVSLPGNGGTIYVGGASGTAATFNNVTTALSTQLNIGSGGGTFGDVTITGNTTFSGVATAGSGTLTIQDGVLGIKGGNFSLPGATSFSGDAGIAATGNITFVAGTYSGMDKLRLIAGWDGVSSFTSPTTSNNGNISLPAGTNIYANYVYLYAGGTGTISQTGGGITANSLYARADTGVIDLAGNNMVDYVSLYSSSSAAPAITYNTNNDMTHLVELSAPNGGITVTTTSNANARDIGIKTINAGGAVSITAQNAIADDGGYGISAPSIQLISQWGIHPSTSWGLAVSADVELTGAATLLRADVANGGYGGGVKVWNDGLVPTTLEMRDSSGSGKDIDYWQQGSDLTLDAGKRFASNYGGIYIGASGNLTANAADFQNLGTTPTEIGLYAQGNLVVNQNITAYSTASRSSFIGLAAGGTITVNSGRTLTSGDVTYGGDIAIMAGITKQFLDDEFDTIDSAQDLGTYLTSVGSKIDILGSVLSYGGEVGMLAGTINVTSGSVEAGTDLYAFSGGNITLNDGAIMVAGNDAYLVLAGASSTLTMNELSSMSPSYIWAKAPSTVNLAFLSRTSGGVIINGVDTLTTSGSSGLFYGSVQTPASPGAGLGLIYSNTSSPVITAITSEIINSTESPATESDDNSALPLPPPPPTDSGFQPPPGETVAGGEGEFGGPPADADKPEDKPEDKPKDEDAKAEREKEKAAKKKLARCG